jgi:hypothetical protein
MQLSLTNIIIAVILGILIYGGFLYNGKKKRLIRESKVVKVKTGKHQYGIPWQIHEAGETKVEVVFPVLERKNWFNDLQVVKFVRFNYDLSDIEPFDHQVSCDVAAACVREVHPLVQTYFEVDPEISNFKRKRKALEKTIRLVSTSDVHAARINSYAEALGELDTAIQRAKDLKDDCLNLIREILIGVELAKLDINEYSGNEEAFEFRVQKVAQDFADFRNNAKAQIEAYTEVLQLSGGLSS